MSVGAPPRTAAVDLYGAELLRAAAGLHERVSLRVVDGGGEELPLSLRRYVGESAADERCVLERATGPVLDVGCGPGRHVLALTRLGVEAVGVDISPLAVALARRRGARVIEGSIFGEIPKAGAFASALLLDGNIGIGGEPAALLARVGSLLERDGLVIVELEGPGVATGTLRVSLETAHERSHWFPWARLSVDGLDGLCEQSGFTIARAVAGRRALVRERRAPSRPPGAGWLIARSWLALAPARVDDALGLEEPDVAVERRAGEALRTAALRV